MQSSVIKTFAVTLGFTMSALLICGAFYGLAELGIGPEVLRGVDNWGEQAMVLVGDSALAGLIVDALRSAATIFWPKDPVSR